MGFIENAHDARFIFLKAETEGGEWGGGGRGEIYQFPGWHISHSQPHSRVSHSQARVSDIITAFRGIENSHRKISFCGAWRSEIQKIRCRTIKQKKKTTRKNWVSSTQSVLDIIHFTETNATQKPSDIADDGAHSNDNESRRTHASLTRTRKKGDPNDAREQRAYAADYARVWYNVMDASSKREVVTWKIYQ